MTTRRRIAVAASAACAALLAAGAAVAANNEGSTAVAAHATARFHVLTTAQRAGYGLLKDKRGISCIAMDSMPGMGAMGVHYAKPALVGDGKLKATTPEALVYAPQGKALRLAAVEYVVLKADWDKRHATAPVLFGHSFNFTPAGNRFGLPAYYSLHAWLYKKNPSGLLAPWNPQVSCK